MTRPIDADHLKWNVGGIKCGTITVDYLMHVIDNEEPTLEVQPVRHATLLNPEPFGECSCCGELIDERSGFNYCPNCGAKLDGPVRKESYIKDEIVHKWIPCSARLPEHPGHYLVTGWHGGRSFVTTMDYHKDYYSGGWRYHEYDVIAWAETPKPYEVKNDSAD